jgi:hypothetical protein
MRVRSTPEPLTDFSPGFLSCFTTYLPINSVSLAELGVAHDGGGVEDPGVPVAGGEELLRL